MVWPAANVGSTNSDAGTDSPSLARADILDLIVKFNQLRAHVTGLMQTVLAVGAYTPTVIVPYSSTLVIDCALGNVFEIGTLTGPVTSISFPNFAAGRTLNIRFAQDGAGGRTVAVSSSTVQGSVNVAPNKISWLTLIGSTAGGFNHFEGSWMMLP